MRRTRTRTKTRRKQNNKEKKQKMKTRKILVIDDDSSVREAIVMTLRHYGYLNIVQAADGVQGVRMVEEHEPDLVITDLTMPNMRGEAVLNWINCEHKPAHPEIKAMVVSADPEGTARQTALAAGADAFLPKPFEIAKLNEIVEGLLIQTIQV